MESISDHRWVVSASPHIRAPETTRRIMWQVTLALAPAGVWGVIRFGWPALWVIALSVGAAVATEAVIQFLARKPVTVSDGSAFLTGLLLAYVLPPARVTAIANPVAGGPQFEIGPLPWYVPVVGAIVAIAIAKHCFGGLGQNIWNPALVGRAFVQVSFPTLVTLSRWPAPWTDAMAQASPLHKDSAIPDYGFVDLFFGLCPGCIGEVSAFLLIAGGVYLIVRKYVDWGLIAAYVGTLLVLVAILPPEAGTAWADMGRTRIALSFYHVFAGGLMLGAFFMATDMVTSPLTRKGQVIYGIGCGVLTTVIRFYSGMPEGVCYSILLMNSAVPLIDRHTRPRLFGGKGK